jgi:formylglycine-generating enzyme required for sulfatase activity
MTKSVIIWIVAAGCCLGGLIAAALAPVGSQSVHPNRSAPSDKRSVNREPSTRPASITESVSQSAPLLVDAPAAPPAEMAWIPGGQFRMGSDPPPPDNPLRIKADEVPAHDVELDGFWMDEHEVTNRQFDEFARMTGYVTFAEKEPTPEELARGGMDLDLAKRSELKPGSICFNAQFNRRAIQLRDQKVPFWEVEVWKYVDGANWRHPDGPDSDIKDRMDHPVVHLSWEDAVAYCQWAGKQLPTEAQWEYASRGGRDSARYPWGDEREPNGQYQCNYWQGVFPNERLTLDGFEGTAPVKSFSPNGYGLYDTSGNVWEWCADYYNDGYYAVSPRRNPTGPSISHDAREPNIIKRVIRGGSFLCNVNSCTGYRCSSRMGAEFNSGTFHTGFRGVVNASRYDQYDKAQQRIAKWRTAEQIP